MNSELYLDETHDIANFSWQAERKNKLLLLICRIAMILGILSIGFSLLSLLNNVSFNPTSDAATFISFICYLVCYRLAKSGRYRLASRLLTGIVTLIVVVIYISVGTLLPLLIFMLPISLAIVFLDTRWIIGISVICLVTALGVIVAQEFLKVYTPTFDPRTLGPMHLFFVLAMFPALIILLWLPSQSQAQTLKQQNEELVLVLRKLQGRQKTNQRVGEQILRLSEQLRQAAYKQTDSSVRQVDVLAQINSSAIELSSAAAQIAASAQYFNETIQAVSQETKSISHTTSLANNESREGLVALEQTREASNEVSQLYEELVEDLTELAGKNTSMRLILSLVANLAQETHLLALNAAIEAAGVGENGERFRVIAHNIRELAARSSQANSQVVGILSELEKGITQAAQRAQNGYTKAHQMNHAVSQANKVLENMQRVVEQTEGQAHLIDQQMQGATEQTSAIKTATVQQEGTSRQVVEALEELKRVAEQTAHDSSIVFSSASSLEGTSKNLERDPVFQ